MKITTAKLQNHTAITTPTKAKKKSQKTHPNTVKDTFQKSSHESLGVKIKTWIKKNITGKGVRIGDYGDQTTQFAILGASMGGAVGCAAGMYAGYKDIKTDTPQVEWRTHDITDPKLKGFTHYVVEDGHYEEEYIGTDSEGNPEYRERYVIDGYWHHYSSNIEYTKVGEYKTPHFKHTGKWTPLSGGLLGLIGGIAIGGIMGFITGVITRIVKEKIQGVQK